MGARTTHGMSSTRTYRVWTNMVARCTSPSHQSFKNYGGRGISVCMRWRDSFECFLVDMGEQPPGCVLDRVDNEGDYTPENCRWTDTTTNNRNRRTTPMFTHGGKTQSLGAWAEEYGIRYKVLLDRIRDGWSIERAISTPVRRRKDNYERA